MPARTRAHQVEEESRRDFASRVPSWWVIRPQESDYGVDAMVEVFRETGETTGIVFGAQFKGTDDARLQTALRVSIRVETAAYWRTLPYPILLTRYHAPTRSHYVAWLHTRQMELRHEGQATFTFRWTPADRWRTNTPERLLAELDAYFAWSGPRTQLPIPLYTQRVDASGDTVPDAQRALRLRNDLRRVAAVIRVETAPPPAGAAVVTFAPDHTRVSLGGVASTTVHHDDNGVESSDVALVIASTLAIVGRAELTSRLTAEYAADASVLDSFDAASMLAQAMRVARRYGDLIHVAERAWERRSESDVLFAGALLAERGNMNDLELAALEGHLRARVQRSAAEGPGTVEAGDRYSLANFLREQNRYAEALVEYELAGTADPGYRSRGYWLGELAATLFDVGRYQDSAELYRAALEVGEDVKAYLSDALARLGRYEEALRLMESRLGSRGAQPLRPVWSLWAIAVAEIVRGRGIREQERDTEAAERKFAEGRRDEASLVDVLSADALHGEAWYEAGLRRAETDKHAEAFVCFVASAVSSKDELSPWCNAIASGLQSAPDVFALVPLVYAAARHVHGDAVMEALYAAAGDDPQRIQPMMEMMQDLADGIDAAVEPTAKVRLPDGRGGFVELEVE